MVRQHFMLVKNNINLEKNSSDKISGATFHLFVRDSLNATLFDADMGSPIIWGERNIVSAATRKNLPTLCKSREVVICFYKLSGEKYIHRGTYRGPNDEHRMRTFFLRVGL